MNDKPDYLLSSVNALRRLEMEPVALSVREVIPASHSEKVLLAAIIRRAAYDIALYKGDRRLAAKTLWRQAYNWVYADDSDVITDPIDRFMSFSNVCLILDRDPAETRHKISKLNKRDVRQYDMFDSHGRL